ncbi:hypothetical protein EW026_g155 [Hermanssonia centrifuga]|uniref:Uncharacterized protein n=1 Tax=Hermanssonia centrifuga TaxID=98765 RepID=A0A4S4KW06_9APHY|nr:hypothetical protein EW026_g155 [Hermanssonia centrifuga]
MDRADGSSRRFELVNSRDAAELEVYVLDAKVYFKMIALKAAPRVPETCSPIAEDTHAIIRAAEHYLWHLRRTPPRSVLRTKICIELHRLKQNTQGDDWLSPTMIPDPDFRKTLRDGEEVDILVDERDKYGVRLLNESDIPLY